MKQCTDLENLLSRIRYSLSKERKKRLESEKLNSFTIADGLGFLKIEFSGESKYYCDSVGNIFYKKDDSRRKQNYNIILILAWILLTNHHLDFNNRLLNQLASPSGSNAYEESESNNITLTYSRKYMVHNAKVNVGYTPLSGKPSDYKRHDPPFLFCDIEFK